MPARGCNRSRPQTFCRPPADEQGRSGVIPGMPRPQRGEQGGGNVACGATRHPGLALRYCDHEGCTRDLPALERLQPRQARISRLHKRMADTETALGSDLMTAALPAYAFLKVASEREGLGTSRRELVAPCARPPRRGVVGNGGARGEDMIWRAEASTIYMV